MQKKKPKFVDRKEELELILDRLDAILHNSAATSPCLEYLGIDGIGKSALLEVICAECSNRGIPYYFFDFSAIDQTGEDSAGVALFAQLISDLFQKSVGTENLSHYTFSATDPNQNAQHQIKTLFGIEKEMFFSKFQIFVFDSIDLLTRDELELIGKSLFLPILDSRKNLIIYTSEVQIEWGELKYKLRRRIDTRQLKELSRKDTEELLVGSLHENISDSIYSITSGHPKSINIVSDIITYIEENEKFKLSNQKFGDYEKRLIEAVVDNSVKDVVIPDRYLKLYGVLSIMRTVHLDLPAEFQIIADRDVQKNNKIDLFDEIRGRTGSGINIIEYDVNRNCYFLNNFIRKTLSLYMRLFHEKDYLSLSKVASDYYTRRFSNESTNIFLLIERIYHLADVLRMSTPPKYDIEIAKHLQEELKEELKSTLAGALYTATHCVEPIGNKNFHMDSDERRRLLDRMKIFIESDLELQERLGDRENPNFLVRVIDEVQQEMDSTGKAILDIIKYNTSSSKENDSMEVYDVSFVLPDRNVDISQNIEIKKKWKENLVEESKRLSNIKELIDIGRLIKNQFLPNRIQEMLRDHDGPLTIRVNDTTIPWELIHDGDEFTVLRLPSGKRLRTAEEPKAINYNQYQENRVLLIGVTETQIADFSSLSYVEDEIIKLSEQLSSIDSIVFNPAEDALIGDKADSWDVLRKLSSGNYKIVHFAGHALYEENGNSSGLILYDDVLRLNQIKRSVEGSPLIFINACQSAVEGVVQSDIGYVGSYTLGIASAFMLSGAIGCIGTIWKVPDESSSSFALKFYKQLVSGVSVGEALLRSKKEQRMESVDDRTWAAYVLYGDPTIKVIE